MPNTRTTDRTTTVGADLREDRPGENEMVPFRETAAQRGKREEALELKNLVADRIARMEQMMPQMEPWLLDAGISPAAFISSFRLAMAKAAKIARCTPASLILGCMDSAHLGLPPDGEQAALVPFKNNKNNGALEATFIPMYKGHLNIIYRTGLISALNCGVIFEGEDGPEHLNYSLGSDPYVDHHPPINRDETKKIIAAWATAVATTGPGKWAEVIGEKGLAKIAKVNVHNDINKAWPSEMARKAPLRRMVKYLPRHPLLDRLNAVEARAYQSLPKENAKSRLSDDDLLSDEPIVQIEDQLAAGVEPEGENDAIIVTDEEINLAQAPLRFIAMLEQAFDGDTLESRAALIHADTVYDALDPAEKALIAMTLRQQRAAFGLDPETGAAAVAE